ncbi:portal protein [Aliirhizobium cellulosilyticum]|uniref:Phage portal protein n=1 Tax=Aliirhizobium cellulosilyticum TaxID=393664 RepID=A0A7W6X7M9_9HYPH|nr:phage portal protein [Rhizobium cellulosilyticum]MBB4347959.1 hypothetical protein [Rhizobium cellulosilyticum]MBB4409647.1 hypothetical protein [Rhizobium cellulosilyticum]MBB4444334.1 hypothetical protein [Rhizobium cellulosilyticum]
MADTKAKPDKLTSIVASLVRDAESYRNELGDDRDKANEYFDGEMNDVPVMVGRSSVVSRDVRANIKKAKPSLVRTLLGNDKVVEYEPVAEGEEAQAEQATEYVNYVILPESKGYEAIEDALTDAMKLRNGILRWYYDKKISVQVSNHTGLDEDAITQLVADDSVEVLEASQTFETIQDLNGSSILTPVYDLKIKRRSEKGRWVVAAVPPEQFLVHPDTIDLDESPLVGINTRERRSDLVAMGFDRKKIYGIPAVGENDDKEMEEDTRRQDIFKFGDDMPKALEELEYYELYVRIDQDDDGIAELRRLIYAGAIKEEYLLSNEEWDEVPFADIVIERRPHQREGVSVTDDTKDDQKVKTVLLRETLDNLYWQNKPQPIAQEEAIVNPDAVLNPSFGKPIRVASGTDVRAALGFTQVPFVAASSFQMLDYFDKRMRDTTGISDASGGLPADALQNVTATASALMEQSGIGQTELMVRTSARGLKRMFKGLLKLIIKHQDKPRTVMLRKKWVTFDPRQWNAEMDATPNVGLGAGTRERDMAAVQMVLGVQEKLLAAYGDVGNPFVKPQNVSNAIGKLVEAAGLPSGDMFFTKPTEQDIAKLEQMQQQQANQPNPEVEKAKAEAAAKAEKQQQDFQLAQQKLANDRELQLERINQEMALKRYQIEQELQLKSRQSAVQALTGEPMSHVSIGGMPG